jgi:hypothetical protein
MQLQGTKNSRYRELPIPATWNASFPLPGTLRSCHLELFVPATGGCNKLVTHNLKKTIAKDERKDYYIDSVRRLPVRRM